MNEVEMLLKNNDCVALDIENYHGHTQACYLVNPKTLEIKEKHINHPSYNILENKEDTIKTLGDLFTSIETQFEVIDSDDDYMFDTENPLIRLQQTSLKDSLLIYGEPDEARRHIGEHPFIIYDNEQQAIDDYFNANNYDMLIEILEETKTNDIDPTKPPESIKSWLFHMHPNYVIFPDGSVIFVSDL